MYRLVKRTYRLCRCTGRPDLIVGGGRGSGGQVFMRCRRCNYVWGWFVWLDIPDPGEDES